VGRKHIHSKSQQGSLSVCLRDLCVGWVLRKSHPSWGIPGSAGEVPPIQALEAYSKGMGENVVGGGRLKTENPVLGICCLQLFT
jgi:hypothetical protein